ncbi:MAG: hypothetical protein ACK401_04800 [Archaeoglobaceae archaeon]
MMTEEVLECFIMSKTLMGKWRPEVPLYIYEKYSGYPKIDAVCIEGEPFRKDFAFEEGSNPAQLSHTV